ncbi:alpha/beta hydrolase [Thermomonospora umbrina]|uniref:alpha/beta hydrolase n=1 Tax=Thermomonospora umbrina TaxID=111806 RepID=UPI001FE609AF|nr:alpha/beta hydrolase [Thermomonospora umbrina]
MLSYPPQRKAVGLAIGAVLAAGLVAAPGPVHAAPAIAWKPCPAKDPIEGASLKGMECGTLAVPLDHDRPDGRRITLALTRVKHTGPKFRGAVLLNRGGPGAHGRDLPALFTKALPKEVAQTYDWIGFDPRGVAASDPSLVCDVTYMDPGRPRADSTPRDRKEEAAWRAKAKAFADDCAKKYGDVLPHMGTASSIRDLEAIRVALGRKQINYFGFSYGTYLGAAYATAHPDKVRRMVLDSVVRPSGVWYPSNLDQNVAFERRIQSFFGWVAANHSVFGLGTSAEAVEKAFYGAREALRSKPIGGKVGPTELDDVFLTDGYSTFRWRTHAQALADYVVRKDPKALGAQWQPPDRLGQNNYTMYAATQCRDAEWPRTWSVWHADSTRLYEAGNRFETWNNTWYNAPCAFWGVRGGPRPRVGDPKGPGMLLVQATEDAATPYPGALEMHGLFPASRLVVQRGGGNHGVSLAGDRCVDAAVLAYLRDAALPADQAGPDVVCQAPPPPKATVKTGPKTPAKSARRLPSGPVPIPANAPWPGTS